MAIDPRQIVEFIRASSEHPMKVKELAKAMKIQSSGYTSFRRAVKQLIDSGEVVKLKRGRIGPADKLNVLVGKITISRAGTGFVPREGDQNDVLIPATDILTALDGDKVMVRMKGLVNGRDAGTVIKVLERVPRNIVGVFEVGKTYSYVVPDNPRIHRNIYIPAADNLGAEPGEKVVAILVEWEHPHLNPEGRVTERLGRPGDPGVDMLSVVRSFNLPQEFPAQVLEDAEKASAADIAAEAKNRLDCTHDCVYTIDPEDAKDFDDAVSVTKTDQGYRLAVHIADVSFFVTEGTALDKEGFERGNSVYLPGMVIPMLPEALSNDVCSLRPNRKRLAHSAFINFDNTGKMLDWEIADTVIQSRARLAYEQVQDYFDTGAVTAQTKPVADNLTLARTLARLLSERRFAEGSLDFDLPESKIILNEKGEVVELRDRIRLEAHRLVEEFMLAANRAVALEVFRQAKPFIYRVHGRPDMEKLQAFSHLMSTLGHRFPVSPTIKPIQFARFLTRIKGSPEEELINELTLRSMQKAVYQRENIGHFGLAFSHYTHFTSPIRRYPDLLVHRLLRILRSGKYTASFAKRVIGVIDNVGEHCSGTERTAEAAEREAVKIKQVAYMARHLGDEFDGVISGVMPFGFFVRLNELGVEGLVRMSSIDDDYYHHEESNYRIVGSRTGRVFRLGDQVRVGVLKVDEARKEIDLFVNKPQEKRKGPPVPGRKLRVGGGRKPTKGTGPMPPRKKQKAGKTKRAPRKRSNRSNRRVQEVLRHQP